MPTATKISEQDLAFIAGTEILPSVAAFDPNADTTLAFNTSQGEYNSAFISTFVDNTPSLDLFYYGTNGSGYVQYTDSIDITLFPNPAQPGFLYDGVKVIGGYLDLDNVLDIYDVYFYGQNIGITDGVIAGSISPIGNGTFISPYVASNAQAIKWMAWSYGAGGVTIAIDDNATDNRTVFLGFPDGMGGLSQGKMFEYDTATEIDNIQFYSSLYNGRFYTLALVDNFPGPIPRLELFNYQLTANLAPDDFSRSQAAFDDPYLNDLLANYYYEALSDGSSFIIIFYEDAGGLINPIICRVRYDWAQYERFNTIAGDSTMTTFYAGILDGSIVPYFYPVPGSNSFLVTGGNEPPVFYGMAGIGAAVFPIQNPQPVAIPCIPPCIPFIR